MNNMLSSFKDTTEFIRLVYFPLSKKQKETFLSTTQSRVDYFIPKMEEIAQIDMGSVKVESMSQFFENYYHKSLSELVIEKGPAYDKTLDYKITSYAYSITISIAKTLFHPLYFIRGTIMKYHEDKIHIPFNLYNRLNFNSLVNKKTVMDYIIVHELSHHLWHKLNSTNNNDSFFLERSWNEGFAEYCRNNYFNKEGFYEDTTPQVSDDIHYDKVKNFLEKNGKKLLLEIPKRWKEFEKEL